MQVRPLPIHEFRMTKHDVKDVVTSSEKTR